MNISKSLATDVAKKLLEKRKEQYLSVQKQLIAMGDRLAQESISPELKKAFEDFKEYFRSDNSVVFITYINDVREEIYLNLSVNIPRTGDRWSKRIEVTEQKFLALSVLQEKLQKQKEDYNKRLGVVSETIFGLRTFNQVKKHFPEAYELLPKTTNGTLLPMVNLDQVRELVKS